MKMQAEVCIFIKLRLQHRCYFPVKFVKFLKTPILKNICERLFYIMMFLHYWCFWCLCFCITSMMMLRKQWKRTFISANLHMCNDTLTAVPNKISHLFAFSFITFLHLISNYFCQYKTLSTDYILFTTDSV